MLWTKGGENVSTLPVEEIWGNDRENLRVLVDEAKCQWQLAQEYFEFVKDPELVDVAINNLAAAEQRYNYLVKQLRKE